MNQATILTNDYIEIGFNPEVRTMRPMPAGSGLPRG